MIFHYKKDKTSTEVNVFKVIKREVVYEYVPLCFKLFGVWREVERGYLGESVKIFIDTPLDYCDRVVINGKEIYEELTEDKQKK